MFLGGLDLCFGRMDSSEHKLHAQESEFPGIDYFNPRIKDFIDGKNHETALIDREQHPRMPWHDIAVLIQGDVTKDFTRHFI